MTRETKAQRHRRLAKALTEHLALVESGEGEPLAGLPSDMTAEEFEDFLHKTTMRRRARSRRLFPSLLTGQRLVRDNDAGWHSTGLQHGSKRLIPGGPAIGVSAPDPGVQAAIDTASLASVPVPSIRKCLETVTLAIFSGSGAKLVGIGSGVISGLKQTSQIRRLAAVEGDNANDDRYSKRA